MVIGFGVILVSYQYVEKYLRATPGEYYSIILLSLSGMMLMASTNELITIYISLELTSIPLYILAGLSRSDARSAEAAVKYVLLGAMSSAILLYGMALLYGATGTTDLTEIAKTVTTLGSGNLLILAADVFIFAGFGFKISAVPFHMWAPDIYEGSPTPSTLFFSVGSKAAGFAALMRVFVFGGLVAASSDLSVGALAIVAALTMTLGNVVALMQSNIKRMMAYSSIGQAGYILWAWRRWRSMKHTAAGTQAMLIFLFVYVVTNIGAFTGIIALADATGRENIRDFDGFGRRSPVDRRRHGAVSAGAGGHPADGWLLQQAVHLLDGLAARLGTHLAGDSRPDQQHDLDCLLRQCRLAHVRHRAGEERAYPGGWRGLADDGRRRHWHLRPLGRLRRCS